MVRKVGKTYITKLEDLSNEIKMYKIYQEEGCGVQEAPNYEGKTLKVMEGTEQDLWIVTQAMNIELHGILNKRNSWETPYITYKEIEVS